MQTEIGSIADTPIIVRTRGSDQEILIGATEVGQALVQLLGGGREARREGTYLVLPHTSGVDRRLMELADVTVAIRYAHPTWVQLTLEMQEVNDGHR